MNTYNGYKNYKTWNVALWIQNDEGLYDLAKACKRAKEPYRAFAIDLSDVWGTESIGKETPDRVQWLDKELDVETLDSLIKDL